MRRIVYSVICCAVNGDEYYHIDSTWTSHKKAEKRCKELNSKGLDYLMENHGWGLFEVVHQILST